MHIMIVRKTLLWLFVYAKKSYLSKNIRFLLNQNKSEHQI